MKQTEAQLRATKKYHSKLENIQVRVPSGEKAKIAEHAKKMNESLNMFVIRAVHEAMERDSSISSNDIQTLEGNQ